MKSIEGNFNNKEVDELLKKHFVELRSVSPEGSTHVLDIKGLQDPSIKFFDPCCKSGVFLREIVKRLNVGLTNDIPNQEDRLHHIFQKQVFGIALT